jgi:heme-degrading monooxygenase HmoA
VRHKMKSGPLFGEIDTPEVHSNYRALDRRPFGSASQGLHLDEVKGFQAFHLLRGPEREDHVLYSSHTIWASQEDFTAWTKSEQFRAAHQHAGEGKPLTLGHPKFEGFEVIQTIETTHPPA